MKKTFLFLSLILSVYSCKENNSDKNEIVEKAAENTESNFSIKRMSKSQDILNGIYSELLKNDAELQKLDEKINSIQNDGKILKNINSDIVSNSDDYYLLAKNSAKSIQDSIMRKEILGLVENSSDKFSVNKNKLEELKKQVRLNNNRIFSFYQALKIRRTIPEIEKYQKAHPLNTDSLNQFINKQNQLLNELKNMK
ncbi:hypothetical protein [Epilithonimonas xixisoli]|uniref:Lipoprotein n=1 Tax=Epilithonimonas xixisoli TaxID=1476462 RepID=A0A4R8I9N2_9FLAO|nr:hypothetical protein [Epilithonimonas xixisoli]TDX86798.1 hypothetical protein B0I22_0950 [Epilithonimonas xixisoli]